MLEILSAPHSMNRILQTTMDFTVQPSETFIHAIKVIFRHVIFFPSKETQVRIRLPENTLHFLFIPKNCENVAESIIEIVRKKQTLRNTRAQEHVNSDTS